MQWNFAVGGAVKKKSDTNDSNFDLDVFSEPLRFKCLHKDNCVFFTWNWKGHYMPEKKIICTTSCHISHIRQWFTSWKKKKKKVSMSKKQSIVSLSSTSTGHTLYVNTIIYRRRLSFMIQPPPYHHTSTSPAGVVTITITQVVPE